MCSVARMLKWKQLKLKLCLLLSPWSGREQIAVMQICSWMQWELLGKQAFPFREARSGSTAAALFDQSPIQRRTEINVPRRPPRHTHLDKHDRHLGFCLSYLNILKRRSRNLFPNDYSLFSKMDRACLKLINLKVISRRSRVQSKRRQWASPRRASS